MNTLTQEQCDKMIAHWRRPIDISDIQKVREMVCGVACQFAATTVEVKVEPTVSLLGYERLVAIIKFNDIAKAVRATDGSLIKGMDEITIRFDRCAGLLSYEEYGKRQEEEFRLFKSLPEEEAKAAINALPWDGEVVEFSGRTNGQIRGYRKHRFYPFEGNNHFGYAPTWDDLKEQVERYVHGILRESGAWFWNLYRPKQHEKVA